MCFFVFIDKGGIKMRKNKKHKVYTIEEKNKIVLLYLDNHIGVSQLIREYDLGSDSVLYHWARQYKELGTVVDGRGKTTKKENPNIGRPKSKPDKSLEEMTREELIERVRLLEDIKKSLACLDQKQKINTK